MTEIKDEWQLREKHENDIRRILEECGCVDTKGQIRRWNGPVVWPKIEAAGHSSVGFDLCKCKCKQNHKNNS